MLTLNITCSKEVFSRYVNAEQTTGTSIRETEKTNEQSKTDVF